MKENIKEILSSPNVMTKEETDIVFSYYNDLKEKSKKNKDLKEDVLEVRNAIALKNQRLIYKIIRIYNFYSNDMEDLFMEGFFGLLTAIDRFDYTLGFSFSTYATGWIRQNIQRYLDNYDSFIKIPVHLSEKINKIKRIQKTYENENKKCTLKDLAKELDENIDKVKYYLGIIDLINVVSLNKQVGESEHGEITELGDFVKSNETESFEKKIFFKEDMKKLKEIIESIVTNKKDLEVIYRRFGFYGRKYTLQEIADIYHVTREAIRLREVRALKKLRRPENLNKLKDYYEYFNENL